MGDDFIAQGSLVVEVLGPPGSGKSTITDQLSELLNPAGRIHTRRELLSSSVARSKSRTAWAFMRAGPAVWGSLHSVFSQPTGNTSPRDRLGQVLRILKYSLAIRESQYPNQLNIYLLEVWLVRFLAGLMNKAQITHDQAASILRYYCESFDPLFVQLDVDNAVLVERVRRRAAERRQSQDGGSGPTLDLMSSTEIARVIVSSEKANRAAVELLRDLGAEVVVLDGTRTPADLSNYIKLLLIKEGRLPIDHLDRAR